MTRNKRLAFGLGACVAAFLVHTQAVTIALEALVDLDMTALSDEGGASIEPTFYSIRGGRLFSLGEPEFRVSDDEPFVRAAEPYGRYRVPASLVRGHTLPVQMRYRTIFGRMRTTRLDADVRPALARARTLYIHEGQPWASVTTDDRGYHLRFSERTDAAATVSYTIDHGPEIALPRGVADVPLTSRPRFYKVVLRTVDGRAHEQGLTWTENHGSYSRVPL